MNNITPQSIKNNNYNAIYHLIYESGKISRQDIAIGLHLSLPTVTQNLVRLEEQGLIEVAGQFDSQIGRKAAAYQLCKNARIGIGVEILRKYIEILAVNLYGEVYQKIRLDYTFSPDDAYYEQVCAAINNFIASLDIDAGQILGIGFAMQGLINPDGSEVIYGEILKTTGLHISTFTSRLPFRCRFFHDAECAAMSELWMKQDLNSAVYLSLGRHLGAAIILDGKILPGKHGHSATIEHISMKPDGERCYCGRRGCLETLCSVNALLKSGETLTEFFDALRRESVPHQERWQKFLTYLADAINHLHMVIDTDFILGGHMAPYLTAEDIRCLHELIRPQTPFEEVPDFIHISRMPENNVPVGAAIPYIKEYLE